MASRKRFSRSFYRRHATEVAPELLGAYLHRVIDGIELIAMIVETEAYAQEDAACHAYRGITPRTRVLFGEAGFSYVYFTYGMHYCFNVSTNEVGRGEAVLVRALEPIEGLDTMRMLRPNIVRPYDLTNGPGKLCQALGMGKGENWIDLIESDTLFITKGKRISKADTATSTRVGISVATELPWRYFIRDNPFVSKGKPSGTGTKSVC